MSVKRFSLALVLCAAMAFTACDKEGGNQPGPDTDPVTPTENTVDVAYAIGGGADFLLIFDAEVKYTDATGKTATEKRIINTKKHLAESKISARCFSFYGNISATICKND